MKTNWLFILSFQVLLVVGSGSRAQESVPKELTQLKEQFLTRVENLSKELPADLNEKYLVRLRGLEESAKEEGNLELVLKYRKAIESVSQEGVPLKSPGIEEKTYLDLRKIYDAEYKKWRQSQSRRYVSIKKNYLQQLQALTAELTRQDRIEDAMAVRNEGRRVQDFSVEAIAPPSRESSGNRGGGGILKGASFRDGKMVSIDFKSGEEEITDWIDIASFGNPRGSLLLRSNGDVYIYNGSGVLEKKASGATTIYASGRNSGYIDSAGSLHAIQGNVPVFVGKPKLAKVVIEGGRYYGIDQSGKLHWGGKDFTAKQWPEPPAKFQSKVSRVGICWGMDCILTESGNLLRRDKDKVYENIRGLTRGVEALAVFAGDGFALADSGVWRLTKSPFRLKGLPDRIRDIALRTQILAFLDRDGIWRVITVNQRDNEPFLKMKAVLEPVLNRTATVDVEWFYNVSAKYYSLFWIEQPGAEVIDLDRPQPLDEENLKSRSQPTTPFH